MYKVLIVDDEKIVHDSISYILNKEFPKQISIKTCFSGKEALELLMVDTYHIAFIDIKMPDIDGLDVIDEIRKTKKDPFPLFIVVSAHDKFEFAKKAVEIGAFSYILKPYSANDITDITKLAIENVSKQLSKMKEEIEKNAQIKVMKQLIENSFLITLTNNYSFDVLDIEKFERIFEINLKSGFFVVLKPKETKEFIENFDLIEKIKNEIKIIFGRNVLISSASGEFLVIFFPVQSPSEYESTKNSIVKVIEQKDFAQLVKIGVSSFYHIVDGYENAFWEAYNNLFNAQTDIQTDIYLEIEYLEKKIIHALYNPYTLTTIEGLINQLYKNYLEAFGEQNVKYKIIKFIIMLLTESSINKSSILPDIEQVIIRLIENNNKELLNVMKDCVFKIISENNKNQEKIVLNDTIANVASFIRDNYNQEISLTNISNKFGLSPYYFSKLFKKYMGINYKEYLIKIRINKSLELLKSTNLSIKEICYAVGFDDPNYFVKIFKKYVGLTPSNYRMQ